MADNLPAIYPEINQNTRSQTAENSMERINSTILKTALEAIPLLTVDNYSLWKNRIGNMLDLQGLCDSLTTPDGTLTCMEDVQLQTIIISKLDSSIHPNVITHENETKARDIWTSITSYFASTQPSKRARVFNELIDLSFNPNDVQTFITSVRTINSRLFEIRIDLPKDMIAYMLLKKLPSSLSNISQQITHSDKPITSDLVLDHLRLFNNDQLVISNRSSTSKTEVVSLFTNASKKCKKNAHNVQSNHPEAKCWMLYPHLRPAPGTNTGRQESSVSSFHTSLSQTSPLFILDSGSSAHMVSNFNLFYAINQTEVGIVRTSSGKDSLQIKGKGSINLINEHGSINLHNVLYVPDLIVNLLSIRCLVLDNYLVEFSKNSFSIFKYGQLKMNSHYTCNLPSLSFVNVKHQSHLSSAEILHKSLGHVSYHRIRHKLRIPLKIVNSCESCSVAKITKASFKNIHAPARRPFEELHLDLIGPIHPPSREGHRYILTVVDSHTRYCSGIPLKNKSDVPEVLSLLIDVEAKRFGHYPSVLHLDRGTEFINQKLQDYCKSHIIKSRTSDPYTPQQNGLAERHNRTILESMRTILKDSGLSQRFWSDIVKVSTLTLNQIPSHKSKKSPFKLFKNRSLPLDYFHPIGNCVSYLILPHKSFSKLMPKGELGTLIGYNDKIQSWKILNDSGKIIDTKHLRSRAGHCSPTQTRLDEDDFDIVEEELPVELETAIQDPLCEEQLELSHDENTGESGVKIEDPETDHSDSESLSSNDSDIEVMESLIPNPAPTQVLRDRTSKVKPVKYSCLTTDPASFKKAMNSSDHSLWKKATDEELDNIEAHNVWDDMWDKPDSYLHTLWIFKTKLSTLSAAEPKKARLCIQGFLQLPDEYGNTFAPTGKFTTLLVLLMFAVDKKLPLRQFDVKSAFLYAPLKEDIYIKTPEGSNQKAPFLKLNKSLYGLKQAPTNWYKTLTGWFEQINFHQSTSDPCLYIHNDGNSFIFFHVDDLIVVGNVEVFEELFMNRFPNSTAHIPDTLLGMDIKHSDRTISLSQPKLIIKGLELLGLNECRSVNTPLSVGAQLTEASTEEKLKINYQSYTGILNYLACRTRPDPAPAVSILSAFNHAPGIKHWKEVLHCWKYLSGTIDLSLTLTPDSSDTSEALEYYTDATWADDLENCLS
ncbi:hypothetical protein MJO29_016595 [Puccinia striiformis f. sp. tritici]|nr:hypothetical protein MJO29_016595 [Puccinia striiformis f. sp. tritici]